MSAAIAVRSLTDYCPLTARTATAVHCPTVPHPLGWDSQDSRTVPPAPRSQVGPPGRWCVRVIRAPRDTQFWPGTGGK